MPSEPVLTYQAILATPILCGRSLRPTPDSTPCPQHFLFFGAIFALEQSVWQGRVWYLQRHLEPELLLGSFQPPLHPSMGCLSPVGLLCSFSQLSPLTPSQATPLRPGELSSGSPPNGFPHDFCRTYLITPVCFCANCRASMRTYKRLLVCFLFSILLLRVDKGHELNHAAYSTRIFSVCLFVVFYLFFFILATTVKYLWHKLALFPFCWFFFIL